MFAQSQARCNRCGGRGRIIVRRMSRMCRQKVLDHIYTAQYTLDVPRGAHEYHEVVFEGEGYERQIGNRVTCGVVLRGCTGRKLSGVQFVRFRTYA